MVFLRKTPILSHRQREMGSGGNWRSRFAVTGFGTKLDNVSERAHRRIGTRGVGHGRQVGAPPHTHSNRGVGECLPQAAHRISNGSRTPVIQVKSADRVNAVEFQSDPRHQLGRNQKSRAAGTLVEVTTAPEPFDALGLRYFATAAYNSATYSQFTRLSTMALR